MSAIACTRDPDARKTTYHQERLTQCSHAATDHRRRSHRTTTESQDLIRMSGTCGRAIEATSPVEARGHGKLWMVKKWKRTTHYSPYAPRAAYVDTLSRELMMLITMGRPEVIQQAWRRRGQQEFKNKKRNVANIPEAHGTTRKSTTARQLVNPVEEGTGRLRSPTEGDPEGRQRGDVPRTMRDLLESTAAHLHGHSSTEFRGRRREHGYHR